MASPKNVHHPPISNREFLCVGRSAPEKVPLFQSSVQNHHHHGRKRDCKEDRIGNCPLNRTGILLEHRDRDGNPDRLTARLIRTIIPIAISSRVFTDARRCGSNASGRPITAVTLHFVHGRSDMRAM